MRLSNKTKLLLVLLAIALLAAGCQQNSFEKNKPFTLQRGDLLFQDSDCGPLCDAIEKVTIGCNNTNLTHVGIVTTDCNGDFVMIEATQNGVETNGLQTFLDRSCDSSGQSKTIVGRLKPQYRRLIPAALKEALALKGKEYDKPFVIGNDRHYCSELIYEIFLRANDNKPVFILQPMTFKDPDTGQIFPAWQDYFDKLNVPVPQGRPGINPGGISRSPALDIIYAYGTPTTK